MSSEPSKVRCLGGSNSVAGLVFWRFLSFFPFFSPSIAARLRNGRFAGRVSRVAGRVPGLRLYGEPGAGPRVFRRLIEISKSSPTPFRLTSLKTSDRTWDAVKLMLQRHVSSVAVFDEKQANFRGFVDILDVATIVFMLNFSKGRMMLFPVVKFRLICWVSSFPELSGALGKEPSWNKFAETELKVLDKSTVEEMINVSGRDPWVDVKFQATASELLGSLAGGKGARRVAVRDAGNAGIEGIVSQWDAVRFLQRQITHAHW